MTTSTVAPVFLPAWVRTVTVAEFAGFLAPACVGALVADAPLAVALPAILLAGAVEGAVLGAGQAVVLRRALPGLPPGRWVAVTASAAVAAYAIGMAPSAAAQVWQAWPAAVTAAVAFLLGTSLLCSIGVAQWTVLRRHIAHAGWWVPANAVAWLAGLTAFLLVSTPLWQPGQAVALIVLIGAAGGLAMAATVAVITGLALRRLVP